MATTGKIAEVLFEKTLETYETQDQLIGMTSLEDPNAGDMQNSGNIIWRPKQQHAPVIEGWDLTGSETDIIEETYPAQLGTPKNDFVQQRADDMRDTRFWERRGEQSGRRQASELNQTIAGAIALQGSKFIRSDTASGYNFIAEGQALLNETQQVDTGRCFVLNDRDTLKYSSDLAARQTLQGRPESDAWAKGQIGANVAGFDVYTGSYLPNLAGGANPNTTVTGTQSFAPEAGSVSATGVVTNVDSRIATIAVAASAGYNVGDKVTMGVNAIGLDDKTDTGTLMTFTVVDKPTGTSISVFPKPIALDDPALSTLEQAYANVDTRIVGGANVVRVNVDTSAKTNLFWDKSAVEVLGGSIPAELFKQYDGMKVISSTMSNGLSMYMVYDGNIATMNFRYRLFTWYGITIAEPQNCGVAVSF